MKPFNLEEAKSGKPVCTRDGKKARILCFDLDNNGYPIAAAITYNKGEDVETFREDGHYDSKNEHHNDLMMVAEKKQGWINVYKSISYENRIVTSGYVYETKEIAKNNADGDDDYIGTFPFEWEG